MSSKKALVVIAHCDDAVLWMGGAIHRLKDWKWHVFSMCNENNDRKIQSFNRSCQMLGVERYQALNFRDYQSDGLFSHNNHDKMKTELIKLIDETYDYVFSHSLEEWNEYGHHDNHQEVGIIASEIAEERSWQHIRFSYYPIYGGDTATVAYRENADFYYQLTYEELRFKLRLIDCFPHEMGSLRALAYPCPNPEAFEGVGLPPPFIEKK